MRGDEHPAVARMVAFHEAGHAVVHSLYGHRLLELNLRTFRHAAEVQLADGCGLLRLQKRLEAKRMRRDVRVAETHIRSALAGPAAEEIYSGNTGRPRRRSTDREGDGLIVRDCLRLIEPSARRRTALHRRLADETVTLLGEHWSKVVAIAEAAVEHRILSGRDVLALMQGRPRPPLSRTEARARNLMRAQFKNELTRRAAEAAR